MDFGPAFFKNSCIIYIEQGAVCLHLRRNRSVNLVREYRIGRIG